MGRIPFEITTAMQKNIIDHTGWEEQCVQICSRLDDTLAVFRLNFQCKND